MLIDKRGGIVDFVVDDNVKIFLRGVSLNLGVCKLFRHFARRLIAVLLIESGRGRVAVCNGTSR
jgi:hypothetical protein